MPLPDNVHPINEEAQRSLEDAGFNAPEQAIESLQHIEALRSAALTAMSGLVKYWASDNPEVSQKASAAISEVAEVTLMKPPS